MSAWSFKKQFAPLILSGTKPTTIRARRKDERDPEPGDIVKLFTGMRTKECQLIGQCKVLARHVIWVAGLQRMIQVHAYSGAGVALWRTLDQEEAVALALRDGFSTVDAFFSFFKVPVRGYLYEFEMVSP